MFQYFSYQIPDLFEDDDFIHSRERVGEVISECARIENEEIRNQIAPAVSGYPEEWRQAILKRVDDLEESDPEYYERLKDSLPF